MRRVVLFVLAAVVCGMTAQVAQAGRAAQPGQAGETPRSWYSVTVATVKPDRVADWIEMQKSEAIPMQQKGGVKLRETWQSGAPFGEGNTLRS